MQSIVRFVFVALFAVGCAGYQEGSSARTPGEVIDDVTIQGAVKAALLREPGVEGLAIDTEVRQGVVTLYGRVSSQAERERVIALVKATGGVKGVDDRLVIVP